MPKKKSKQIAITLLRSPIGAIPSHRSTVRALGLRRINQTVYKPANPAVRGMANSIQHMVKVEEIE